MVMQEEYVDEGMQTMGGMPVYGGMPQMQMASEKADLLDKIKPDLIITTFMNRLQGKEMINGNWELINPDRALTLKGAWDIANLMLSASSQNIAISKVTGDRDIRKRTESIVATAIYMCMKNWREYGIRGPDQLRFIHEIVFSNTFITLKQPQDEGIRNMIKNISSGDIGFAPQEQPTGWDVFRK